jgi:hypothetical protein
MHEIYNDNYLKCQYKLSNFIIEAATISGKDAIEIAKNEITLKVAKYILNKYNIEESKDMDFTTFNLDLLVFKYDEFKGIVSNIIKELSPSQIEEIRNKAIKI